MANIAFIGLGVMGSAIASHLHAHGHRLSVYNRTEKRSESFVQRNGGMIAKTPAQASENADFVITCVGNDDDLQDVINSSNGVFSSMKAGAIVIDHTTASAKLARLLSEQADTLNLGFLDAPVSGGQRGAEEGKLAIMVGGNQAHFAKALPILSVYGKTVMHMGNSGTGQLTKMVNQIAIAGLLQGLSESLAFGKKSGLDMEKVLAVISDGAAASWQMTNRAETMLNGQFNFGFAVDWMRKDLAICLSEARCINARLPVTALVDQFYANVQANDGGRFDTSSLITLLEEKNNIESE